MIGSQLLSDYDSCNSFGTTYAVDAAEIRIAAFPLTTMACPDPVMQQETAYIQLLTAARQWWIEGEELIIEAEGGRLRFQRAAGLNGQP